MRNITPSYDPGRTPDAARTASLVAMACVLQIAESLIPNPVPGVRLGLANMVTLVTLVEFGPGSAMEVAALRTVLSSLVMGSFLTPGFILSFASAVVSAAVMWALWGFTRRFPSAGLSIIGVSVAGAAAHNAAQLFLAYLIMIRHPSILYFAPWLALSGVIMGWTTGLVAAEVLRRTRTGAVAIFPAFAGTASHAEEPPRGASFMHRLAPEWKIVLAASALLLAVSIRDLRGFLVLGAGVLALMVMTRLGLRDYSVILKKIRRLSSLALIAFFFPLFFSAGAGDPLFSAGPIEFTRQGLLTGTVFAARIIVMGWIGFLLNIYASPAEIAAGIGRLGRPFRSLGFPADRIGSVISMAWGEIPVHSARTRAAVGACFSRGPRRGGVRGPGGAFVGPLAGMIAGLYRIPAGGTGDAAEARLETAAV